MNTIARPLLLDLSETTAHTREIALTVAGFEIRGQVALDGAVLHLQGHEGSVSAERMVITSVTITGHGLRLGAQQLEAARATIGWGSAGFQLEAASLAVRAVQLIRDEEPVEGTLVLDGIAVSDLSVERGDVRIGQARIERALADATMAARSGAAAGARELEGAAPPSVVEQWLPVLDRLSGHLNVDLGLDLTVPVIGRRRATHEFRIPIDAGTIDFRRLESNLSTLEDALLDFSVRDEGLVLEVGIPFIPTRGRGKPIVRWPVDGADLELARQQRVRLSVLARPGVGNGNGHGNGSGNGNAHRDSGGEGEERPSPVALRHAQLGQLDLQLSVARADDSPIRGVGSLVLVGDAVYAADDAGNGARVRFETRELAVANLYVVLGGEPRGAGTRDTRRDAAGGEHARVPHARRS